MRKTTADYLFALYPNHGKRPTSPDVPRSEPCFEVNPDLWRYYCILKDRPLFPAPAWWTEADVVQSLDQFEAEALKGLQDRFDDILSGKVADSLL